MAHRWGCQCQRCTAAHSLGTAIANVIPAITTAFARWVQIALNRAINAGLAVTGQMNRSTRRALRRFQGQRGLPVTGLADPLTVAALARAIGWAPGRPVPPVSPARVSGPIGPGSTAGPIGIPAPIGHAPSLLALRRRIVEVARNEWRRWGRGAIKESNPRMRPVLARYWQVGVGRMRTEPNWWSAIPWSAAFISWVMRQAGASSSFRYSGGHATYIAAARQNRLSRNHNPIKAFRTSEIAPRPGDLVCKRRAGSGATYDNVRPGMATHCDVVVAIRPGAITTIGGNVNNSVSARTVHTDARGRIVDPAFFAVIRVGG